MTDVPALRFDHYEIIAPLGKGGMGEVYRARDTRLNREIAIKVLPAEFAPDADRLRRFELEAMATSSLNHPNILTVYDFGTHDGNPYLVMELLEGGELRAQLGAGAMPVRKAIEYAQQIAAGLAAAHDKGLVHRDLKPENLFVTKDGRVKILDFGLAKLTQLRNADRGMRIAEDADTLMQSPDGNPNSAIPNLQLTIPGTVMGTVAYMSPEQVRGQDLEQRSDIFSFGLILYEMLAGQHAFQGKSQAETMAAIANAEPPELNETNAKISPQLEKIVRRCLEKKPERRFQTASDLGFALEALSTPSSSGANRTEAVQALDTATMTKRGGWRERIAWIAAGVLALALLALGVAYSRRPALEAEMVRLFVNSPEKATRFDYPTISPDGRTLAFVATVEGKTQLWVRPLNATTTKPLAEVGSYVTRPLPFWSPDSQFLAFFDGGKLKKVALSGGAPVILCDAPSAGGGTWNREGVILFGDGAAGIKRISANGGAVTVTRTVDSSRGEIYHIAPIFLPDGRHFLFYLANSDPTKRGAYLASLDGGEAKLLLPLDSPLVGVTTNPAARNESYLVFVRQGALLAQAFDFNRNQLTGEPVRLAEQPHFIVANDGSHIQSSLSANGVLVLIEGNANQQLAWFDRAGKKLGTVGSAGIYGVPRLSPDEQRLAVGRRELQTRTSDIHLFDLARGTDTRFTFDPAPDIYPCWSPDGSRLVWTSTREGVGNLYQKAASGAGQDEALLRSAYPKLALGWSADGRFILYRESGAQTSNDLWVLPLEGERKPWPWLNTPFSEISGKFAPDGKWIAYDSDESGRREIYLQAFVPGAPASGGKWQLSTNGGDTAQWRRDGRELYYLSADNKLMAVDVTLGTEVKAGTPHELIALSSIRRITGTNYTLTGDGQRFLFVTSADEASVPPFTVVLNWMAEMKW